MQTGNPAADDDDRLDVILLEYVEAIEKGDRPDRDRLLAQYPEYAGQLRSFFATRDQIDRIAAPLRQAPQMHRPESDTTGSFPKQGNVSHGPALHIGRVGDFRLLREVGRGGMGVVYEAEQVSLRRRVALKILPFAAAIDPRHLQRFRNEAQAAAQLHHSNIVPVHAVGAEGGVHFYAMQFIDGQSLSQLLAELRDGMRPPSASTLPDRPDRLTGADSASGAMTTERMVRRWDYFRRVADLVRQAADALEYAHQAGIVHRDIKPANLLLDAAGRLWVTDFGLALIRSDVGLTATGEVVGTVRYMSPEQALGTPGLVDHRTDIYSLGATLYELLTLAPLFEGDDRRTLLRQLAEDDPRPPRTLDRTIPSELETIVLKAIAKSPTDRYSSAREFADDIQRFLDDRPILARRPTLLDQAMKWVRRHRVSASVGVMLLALAAGGFAVSTAIIAREHAETKRAYEGERQANERERERAAEALENYLRTKRAVDLFVELSDEELLDFPPLATLRQRLLEAAVAYYRELTNRRDDPAVRADLEASEKRLIELQGELDAMNDINATVFLDQAAVRDDLQLQTEQTARLARLLDHLKAQQQAPSSNTTGGNRRGRVTQLASECRKEVERVLTAAQHRRLREIVLQVPGPHVFGSTTLNTLALTDAQRMEVRRILAAATQASLRLMGATGNRVEAHSQFEVVWQEATTRIIALMTPAQRERWAEMTGPPVRGEVRFPLTVPLQAK